MDAEQGIEAMSLSVRPVSRTYRKPMVAVRFDRSCHWSPKYHVNLVSDEPPAGNPNPGFSVKKPWPFPIAIASTVYFKGSDCPLTGVKEVTMGAVRKRAGVELESRRVHRRMVNVLERGKGIRNEAPHKAVLFVREAIKQLPGGLQLPIHFHNWFQVSEG